MNSMAITQLAPDGTSLLSKVDCYHQSNWNFLKLFFELELF